MLYKEIFSLRNITLPTSSTMYWTQLFKLYLTLYCVLYYKVYCTKTEKCLAELVYSLRNSFLSACMLYWTLYCFMYWSLHCQLLSTLFSLENQVQCTVKYVFNLHYSLLYIIQHNVWDREVIFPQGRSIYVHYRVQYSVE